MVATRHPAVETNTAAISYLAAKEEDLVSNERSQTPMLILPQPKESFLHPKPIEASRSLIGTTVSSATSFRTLDLGAILMALWLVGVTLGIAILARTFHIQAIFRRQLTPIKDSRYEELLAQLGQQFKISRTPSLAISATTQSPCLMGLIKPVIVIPESLATEFDYEKIRMILAHELAHDKRRDLWWCWLPTIARIAFFFNPLVWVALKKWYIAREMACDELVLNVTNFLPASYGEVLVNIASQTKERRFSASPASISMVQSSSLKRRLVAMSHLTNPSRFSVRSISLVIFVSLTAVIGLIPWQPVEKKASAQDPQSDSTHDGGVQEKLLPIVSEPKPEVIGEGAKDPSVELTFADLKFDIEIGKTFERSFLPDKIEALDGKEITLIGYMRPSFEASGINAFVFVRDIKENCFGPTAAIYDSIMVQMKKGTQTNYRVGPFKIRGTFVLEEREGPDGKPWAIYNLKNTTIDPTLLDSGAPSKIHDRAVFINELRKYQENFKNRFAVTIAKRKKLQKQHFALRVQGLGSVHESMAVEIAKAMQSLRIQLGKLQNERAKNERAEDAGPDGVKHRVWEIKRNGKEKNEEVVPALKMRLLEAKANAELLLQKFGTEHPKYEQATAVLKIVEQQLADIEAQADAEDFIHPAVFMARRNAEIEQDIKDLTRMIAEQDEQWQAHNKMAIELSEIQQQIARLDEELADIRAAQRLGAELLLKASMSEILPNAKGPDDATGVHEQNYSELQDKL
jgi:beta-lactamase regulating signal transducer with metallopeptidase domain